jgi:hypothetical protein
MQTKFHVYAAPLNLCGINLDAREKIGSLRRLISRWMPGAIYYQYSGRLEAGHYE